MKIKIKGYICQTSWGEELTIQPSDPGVDCEYSLCHREFEVEIPISSLRFNPTDRAGRDAAFREHKLDYLESKKVSLKQELSETEEEIKELMALPMMEEES